MKHLSKALFMIPIALVSNIFVASGATLQNPQNETTTYSNNQNNSSSSSSSFNSTNTATSGVANSHVGPADITYWTVKQGDTLWKISSATGVSVNTILDYNNIANVSDLMAGQIIEVPPIWTVKSGDTLWTISRNTGVSVLNITLANGIQNPNDIPVGTVLNIPPVNSDRIMYYHSASKSIKQIALTFDDGPDNKWTPQILDILHQYNVKATFFIVGTQAI
jgi:LysM repeat protein